MKAASAMALCCSGTLSDAKCPRGAPEGRGVDSKCNQWDSVHLASALRDTPGRGAGGDRSLQSGRRDQSSGESWAPPRPRAALCSAAPVATPPWGVLAEGAVAVMVGSL